MADDTTPRSRATASNDRLAPSLARRRRAIDLISSVISARTRARIDGALMRPMVSYESTALDIPVRARDSCSQQRALLTDWTRESTMQLIVGAGAIGSALARQLADDGEKVRLVTRGGSGPEHPLIERVAADAADASALRRLADGVEVVYNAANPAYHRWPELWPPMAGAMLAAAKDNDAVLVITGNLYVYGPVDRPMTEDMPLAAPTVKGQVRVRMWQEALASGVKVFEARGSDYISPKHSLLEMALPAMRAGKTAWLPAPLDIPHTFTYTGDMASTMIALAQDSRAWGKAWHVPSAPAMTVRELLTRTAQVAGLPAP